MARRLESSLDVAVGHGITVARPDRAGIVIERTEDGMTNDGQAATPGLRSALAAGALALALAACGGGGPADAGDGADGAGEDGASFAAGFGGAGGGGGTLTFDGEQIEITSAVCVLQADTFDVGTVSDNGFRVLVSLNNPQNPISVQILDSDFLQWFQEGNDDQVTRNGSTFTSEERSYFNNSDDRTVNASFTIECP
jgi:hypothetical protein